MIVVPPSPQTTPTVDKRRDASSKSKKKRKKFLLENKRINEASDVLFEDTMLNVAHSFKAVASFRASEFQELGDEIGDEIKLTTKSYLHDLGINVKALASKVDAREDDMTSVTDEETRDFGDEIEDEIKHTTKSYLKDLRNNVKALASKVDVRGDDMTSVTGEESRMPASIVDSAAADDTLVTDGDGGTMLGDDTKNDEIVGFFYTLFSICSALNCADMEAFGGDFLNDKNEIKVEKKDDAESEVSKVKKKEEEEKQKEEEWKKNLEGIDWKQIANEAEAEALDALKASGDSKASSDNKEKKSWKLFKRRGSTKK